MTREDIIKTENKVYSRPKLLLDNTMHYCPGCSHGVVHKSWRKSSTNSVLNTTPSE